MPVPITPADMAEEEYKYFLRDMVPPAPGVYERIETAVLSPEKALRIENMNDLFLDGYLDGEFGYAQLEDGSLVVANLMKMPNVTVEMFDWWFAWHGLKPIRYKLWDKDEHYDISTQNPERRRDLSIPLKERIWDTVDFAVEENPVDGPHTVAIHFRDPADIGFDREKLSCFDGTIVCAADEKAPVVMCHFVRPIEGGIELRSRFWMGKCIVDGKPRSALPEGVKMPLAIGKNVLTHNNKEFSNLAAILPEVFEEFKDKW